MMRLSGKESMNGLGSKTTRSVLISTSLIYIQFASLFFLTIFC